MNTHRRVSCEDKDTEEAHHEMRRAEIRGMQLQAKECQGIAATPEAKRKLMEQTVS